MDNLGEIRSKFENAIREYNFKIEDFPKIEELIEKYHILSSQLKNGDSLEIILFNEKNEDKYGNNKWVTPTIDIILKNWEDKPRTILYHNVNIIVYPLNMELYCTVAAYIMIK